MLVACSLVNLTNWETARPVHSKLRGLYSIRRLADADPDELHDLLRPLGLWRRRSITLVLMAKAWLRERPEGYDDVLRLPGCGSYAADSWAIFVEGRTDVEPRDGKLNWYLDQLKRRSKRR